MNLCRGSGDSGAFFSSCVLHLTIDNRGGWLMFCFQEEAYKFFLLHF